MPSFCAAVGCSNSSAKLKCQEKKISFFKFPLNNKPILKEWLAKLKRKDFHPNQYSQLCSEHFEEESFTYQNFTNKRFLKPNAVPSKLPHFSSQQKTKRQRTSYEFLKMPRLRGRARNIGRRTRNAQLAYDCRLNRSVDEHSTDNINLRYQVECTRANENSEQRTQRLHANTLRQREARQRATNAHRDRDQRRVQVGEVYQIHLKKHRNLENAIVVSTESLPIISEIHGKDYFKEHPFLNQPVKENEDQLQNVNSTVIKVECFEEEQDSCENIESAQNFSLKTTQAAERDSNIPFSEVNKAKCSCVQLNDEKHLSIDENQLLIDVIKYLDGCAISDKFDMAGKLYATKLRSVTFHNQQIMAENLCRQVLLEAEHFNLGDDVALSKKYSDSRLNTRKPNSKVENKSPINTLTDSHIDKNVLLEGIQSRLSKYAKEDRFDKFAKFYATKMRSFSESQYFYADKLINEIVLEAELCRLRPNFRLTNINIFTSNNLAGGKSYANKHQVEPSLVTSSEAPVPNVPSFEASTLKSPARKSNSVPLKPLDRSSGIQLEISMASSPNELISTPYVLLPNKFSPKSLPSQFKSESWSTKKLLSTKSYSSVNKLVPSIKLLEDKAPKLISS